MTADHVVLVDPDDRPIGTMEKLEAHRLGRLHRAFSVLLVDGAGRILLQQRALTKYHSGGLWSNTCCSHPRPGESLGAAVRRRLVEELGVAAPASPAFGMTYRAELDRGLVEHELDHVFVGAYEGPVDPDPAEVEAVQWAPLADLQRDAETRPERYTAWFRLLLAHPDLPAALTAPLRTHA